MKYSRGRNGVQGGKCGRRGGTAAAVPPRRPRLEARGAPRRAEDVGCGRRNAEGLRRGVVHGLERIGPLQNLRIVARKSDKDNETGAAREPLAGQAKRSAELLVSEDEVDVAAVLALPAFARAGFGGVSR